MFYFLVRPIILSILFVCNNLSSSCNSIGFSPIRPWGLCQNFCMRGRVKEELHKQYPKSIPLLEPHGLDETISERIKSLENFLNQFICDVEYMREYDGENDIGNDNEQELFGENDDENDNEKTDERDDNETDNRRGGKKFSPF
jgi:hypothetical protein